MNHIYKNIKGTIILDVPSVRKSILDDIINALDGFDPGLVMDSAIGGAGSLSLICTLANTVEIHTEKYLA